MAEFIRAAVLGLVVCSLALVSPARAEDTRGSALKVSEILLGDGGDALEAEPAAPGPVEVFKWIAAEIDVGRITGPARARVAVLGISRPGGIEATLQDWLLPRRPDWDALGAQLVGAVATRFELVEFDPAEVTPDALALLAFERTPRRIAEVNKSLDTDGVLVVRLSRDWSLTSDATAEVLLLTGRASSHAYEIAGGGVLPGALCRWNERAALPLLLLLAPLALSRLRGRGSLTIRLDQRGAADGNASYTVYVARSSVRTDASGRHVIASQVMTGATITLDRLPVGELCVALRRVERDPESLQVASNQLRERSVAIQRGGNVGVSFDFDADGATLNVSLAKADESEVSEQALLGIQGKANSARYVRSGKASLNLAQGAHVILVGIDDRAFRVPVRIPAKAREVEVKVNVDAASKALFTGCRDAVGPFLNGDLDAAANALEAEGHDKQAALLRAELHQARGRDAEAAKAFEVAGHLKEAAKVRASTGDAVGTASLLERAGDWEGAARQRRNAGDHAAAARAYARTKKWDDALECARQSGDRSLLSEVLEQKGEHLDAAQIALEQGEVERGIRLLQAVSMADLRYGETCLLLAQLFCQRDEPELSLQKLDEAGDVFGSESSLELREQIANKLQEKGDLRAALECFEHIRKRDIRYPGMVEKIEALRDEIKKGSKSGTQRAQPTTPPEADSRYEIEGEIGRGGMGVVFRARDKMLGRVVALKQLPENLKEHPTAVKMFLREARSVAALNHPNIVTLYDAGQEEGAYYITMEFLEGQPLNTLLKRRKRLSVNDAVRVSIQVADGLGYAHGENIVHRDIKPSNLFFTTRRRIKIMDFGLAKMMEEVRKQASIIAGTPFYMAPEQALGEVVDQRTDLYAFGVTLYELLVGDVPFRKGDVAYHHRHTPPPDPREALPDLPAPLAELVLDLMAKRPEDRPEDADVVRARLSALIRRS